MSGERGHWSLEVDERKNYWAPGSGNKWTFHPDPFQPTKPKPVENTTTNWTPSTSSGSYSDDSGFDDLFVSLIVAACAWGCYYAGNNWFDASSGLMHLLCYGAAALIGFKAAVMFVPAALKVTVTLLKWAVWLIVLVGIGWIVVAVAEQPQNAGVHTPSRHPQTQG